MPIYTFRNPPAYSATYVKATSETASQYAYLMFDPSTSKVSSASGTSWLSTGGAPQRVNVDYGVAFVPNRIFIENYHSSGTLTTYGVQNIRVYGSNVSSTLTNVTPTDLTDLTLIGEFTVPEHVSADTTDFQQFYFVNISTAYRYYSIIALDNAGGAYVGMRSFQLYSADTADKSILNTSVNALARPFIRKILYASSIVGTPPKVVTGIWFRKIPNIKYKNSSICTVTNDLLNTLYPIVTPQTSVTPRYIIAIWAGSVYPYIDTFGSIAGVANVGETILNNIPIRLYYKPSGMIISACQTDSLGRFRFDFLEVGKPLYTIVAHREGYNAAIVDSISPVKTSSLPNQN